MTKKQYRLNKWGTRLLKNNRPLFDWTNESDEIVDLLNKLNDENEQLKELYTKLEYRHSLLHDVCIEAECDRDGYQKDVLSLEKENERLKQRIKSITEILKEDIGYIESLRKIEEVLK